VTTCGVLADADADADADAGRGVADALARALEANERWQRVVAELPEENAGLREALARRDGELEQMAAELAVLKRMVSGRSSERMRAGDAGGEDAGVGGGSPRRRDRAGAHRMPRWVSGGGWWCYWTPTCCCALMNAEPSRATVEGLLLWERWNWRADRAQGAGLQGMVMVTR
jgi:hypothetical protein